MFYKEVPIDTIILEIFIEHIEANKLESLKSCSRVEKSYQNNDKSYTIKAGVSLSKKRLRIKTNINSYLSRKNYHKITPEDFNKFLNKISDEYGMQKDKIRVTEMHILIDVIPNRITTSTILTSVLFIEYWLRSNFENTIYFNPSKKLKRSKDRLAIYDKRNESTLPYPLLKKRN
jgi:tagatose-1,6-bisphosphate aldolase non-catalytic subunit AgaZ/GatZ